MLHDLHLLKKDGRLFPATEEDKILWQKVPNNETFRVKLNLTRNPRFHRMTWALAEKIAENWPGDSKPASWEVMRWLKLKTDLVEYAKNLDTGELEAIPASTSFSAMNQIEYGVWFDRAMKVAARKLGISVEDLHDELDETKTRGKCSNPDCNNPATDTHEIFGGTAFRQRSIALGYQVRICRVCHLESEREGERDGMTNIEWWRRLWCGVLKIDYDEAYRKVASAEKIYKIKKG